MVQHWLDLEEEIYNSFSVIAIHTGMRSYRLAYALNKHLGIQLKRSKNDLNLDIQGRDFCFSLYEFYHPKLLEQFDLVRNRSVRVVKLDGIIHYEDRETDSYEVDYLIPEHKKVDYFLKLEVSENSLPLDQITSKINKISGIQSVYVLERPLIKSIYNLIFD